MSAVAEGPATEKAEVENGKSEVGIEHPGESDLLPPFAFVGPTGIHRLDPARQNALTPELSDES